MANDDAWSSGWDQGSGAKQKREDKKNKGKSNLIHQPTPASVANPSAFKKGGKVKKTGVAKVHRGERVLTAKEAKKYAKNKGTRKRVAGKG